MMPDRTRTRSEDRATQKKQPVSQPPALDPQGPTSPFPARGLIQRAMHVPGILTPPEVLRLQRLVGNRAVTQLLPQASAGPPRPVVQPRRMVGPAGDGDEQEADRVAEQVVGMPAPAGDLRPATHNHAAVQRQEEEEELQAQPPAATITPPLQRQTEEEDLQAKPAGAQQESPTENPLGSFAVSSGVESVLAAGKGNGRPLPHEVRAFMEPRLGVDLSGVRVHADGEAARLNRTLSAQAFTHGQDIYLGAGKYNPGTDGGKRLLAHELTHVVQQSGGAVQRALPRPISTRLLAADRGIQRKFAGELAGFKIPDTTPRLVEQLQAQTRYGPDEHTAGDIAALASSKTNTLSTLAELAGKLTWMRAERDRGTTFVRESRRGTVETEIETKPNSGWGGLTVSYQLDGEGLKFRAQVLANPDLVWADGDTIPVTLQPDTLPDKCIGEIKMPRGAANAVSIHVQYTYEELARLAKADLKGCRDGPAKREKIADTLPQMGVLAMWRTEEGRGEQHRSGGIDQKGGSGLINIVSTITTEALGTTEQYIRNVGWNEGELMKAGRPIYDQFPHLLQLEKEMATTLEAESEYMVTPEDYTRIKAAMATLVSMDPATLERDYAIVQPVKAAEEKVYEDTYYDLGGTTDEGAFPLLASDIVFRRRSVATDPAGTNLIAIKGRSQKSADGGEAIRLAAQIQTQYDLLAPDQQAEVRDFLRTQGDNAFGRVLQDALRARGRADLLEQSFTIKKALAVSSIRTKYKMWLANQTMIDFSLDKAYGSTDEIPKSEDNVVYSFEFGVGHPGLVASASGAGLAEEEQSPELSRIKVLEERQKTEPTKGREALLAAKQAEYQKTRSRLVHRPYHVPKDLENPSLFAKGDFAQYQNLRNDIISKLFRLDRGALLKGGNKAKVLAEKMGLRVGPASAPPKASPAPTAVPRRKPVMPVVAPASRPAPLAVPTGKPLAPASRPAPLTVPQAPASRPAPLAVPTGYPLAPTAAPTRAPLGREAQRMTMSWVNFPRLNEPRDNQPVVSPLYHNESIPADLGGIEKNVSFGQTFLNTRKSLEYKADSGRIPRDGVDIAKRWHQGVETDNYMITDGHHRAIWCGYHGLEFTVTLKTKKLAGASVKDMYYRAGPGGAPTAPTRAAAGAGSAADPRRGVVAEKQPPAARAAASEVEERRAPPPRGAAATVAAGSAVVPTAAAAAVEPAAGPRGGPLTVEKCLSAEAVGAACDEFKRAVLSREARHPKYPEGSYEQRYRGMADAIRNAANPIFWGSRKFAGRSFFKAIADGETRGVMLATASETEAHIDNVVGIEGGGDALVKKAKELAPKVTLCAADEGVAGYYHTRHGFAFQSGQKSGPMTYEPRADSAGGL